MIVAEFDYTLEDLKEASRAHGKTAGKGFGQPRRGGLPRWTGYVLFGGLAVIFFILLQRHPTTVPATPPIVPPPGQNNVLTNVIIPIIPWVLVFSFIFFFYRARRFGGVQRIWDSEPRLQLHKRMEADDRRFVLDDGQMRIEQSWNAFRRFIETPNLFLLYTSDIAFHMIPKRAFAAMPGQLEEFRRLIEQQIQPPTGGFPVQPPPTLP